MTQVKSQIVEVLREDGLLQGLSRARNPVFLEDIVKKIPSTQGNGKESELKLGFQTLSKFDISYSGIIQRQLRQHLDELDADSSEPWSKFSQLSNDSLDENSVSDESLLEEQASGFNRPIEEQYMEFDTDVETSPDKEFSAQHVQDAVKQLHEKIVADCEKTLNRMLTEPNEVAYSMAREFSDRVLRAAGVEKEWRKFLYKERALVWDEFKHIADQTEK